MTAQGHLIRSQRGTANLIRRLRLVVDCSDGFARDKSREKVRSPERRGFTMVELLVTVTIIGMMASLLVTAMLQAQELARAARTKSLIARLNAEMLGRFETYRTRRLPIDPNVGRDPRGTTASPSSGVLTAPGMNNPLQFDAFYTTPANGYPTSSANRASRSLQVALKSLYARREFLRREMPDRYQDLVLLHGDNATQIPYGYVDVTTGNIPIPFTQSLSLPTGTNMREPLFLFREWTNGPPYVGFATAEMSPVQNINLLYPVVPALMQAYQRRINSNLRYQYQAAGNTGTTDSIFKNMAQQHEGAECLHLILTSAQGEDDTGRALFLENEVRDTDGDGMPEFIDGWGRPIAWIRWPAGFVSPLQQADDVVTPELVPLRWNTLNSLATTPIARDPFDLRGVSIYVNPASINPAEPNGPVKNPPQNEGTVGVLDVASAPYPTGLPDDPATTDDDSLCPWGWGFAITPLIVSAGRDSEFGLNMGKSAASSRLFTAVPASATDRIWFRKLTDPYSLFKFYKLSDTAAATGYAQMGAVIYGDRNGLNGGVQVHSDNIHNHALGTR